MEPPPTLRHRLLSLALLALVLASLTLSAPWTVAQAQTRVQIPIMRVGVSRPPTPTPTPLPTLPSPLAQDMADRIAQAPEQHRPYMVVDPILQQVAQAKAEDMANRNYFSHTNPDGYGANYLVQQAGYTLPSYYGTNPTDNNIESLAAGVDDGLEIWQAWLASEGHRVHILGETSFFASQVEYGVGYAYNPNSNYCHYWVFISAEKG